MQKARATVGSWANVIGWRPLLCETRFGKKEKDQRGLCIAPKTRNPNFQHSMCVNMSTSINSFHGNLLYPGRVSFIDWLMAVERQNMIITF